MNSLAKSDTINLGIGQLPENLPASVMNKGIAAFQDNQTRYTSNQGLLELRELVAYHHSKKANKSVSIDQVVITNGAEGALWNIFFTYLEPQDVVLIPDIAFSVYQTITQLQGAKTVTYRLNEDFSIDFEDLNSKLTEAVKFIVINSPNNPTGSILPSSDIKALANIVDKNDIYIISDEIYSDLYFSHSRPDTPLAYTDKVIVVDGISKRAAATGLRIGWTISPTSIATNMIITNQYVATCASSISQHAAIASLNGSTDDFVQRICVNLEEKSEYIYKSLKEIPHVNVEKPQGAFYIFPDISYYGSSTDVAHKMLDQVNVLTIPGIAFGKRGDSHLRISYATDMAKLIEACKQIQKFFANWK